MRATHNTFLSRLVATPGYDMEDAMILNKSSMERGLCHATLIKTEMVDLKGSGMGAAKAAREGFAAEPLPEKLKVG